MQQPICDTCGQPIYDRRAAETQDGKLCHVDDRECQQSNIKYIGYVQK